MNWYYEQSGVSIGPVDESALSGLVDSGALQGDSLVWHPGLDDWTTAILLQPALFVPRAPQVADVAPTPSQEPAEEDQEPEIKVRPVRGGAPSPSRVVRHAPSGEAPPPPLPAKKAGSKDLSVKKPGLLKRLFGGGE